MCVFNYFNNSPQPPVSRRGKAHTHVQIVSFHSVQHIFVAGGKLCYKFYVCRITCCTVRCLWDMSQLIMLD